MNKEVLHMCRVVGAIYHSLLEMEGLGVVEASSIFESIIESLFNAGLFTVEE